NEKTFNTNTSYEENQKLSASLKRFFTDLNSGKNGILGEPEMMDFYIVDNVLKGELANVISNWDMVKARLNAVKDTYAWMPQLINKLEKDESMRLGFTQYYGSLHYMEHVTYQWKEDKDKGFMFTRIVVNEQSLVKQVKETWKSDFILSKYVNQEHAVTPEAFEEIKNRYEEIKKSLDPVATRQLMSDLGITLSDKLWDIITSGKYEFNNRELTFQQFINAPLTHVINAIKGSVGNTIEDIDPFTDRVFEKLAKSEAKYTANIYPSSHRAGNKTVNSFGLNKFLVDWINVLKSSNNSEELLKTPFHSTSMLLQKFNEERNSKDKPFSDNIKVTAASLEALHKQGTRSKDNMELHNLGVDEYEYRTAATILSSIPDATGNNQRIINPLFLTTSDKSTAHEITLPAFPIEFNADGTLNNKTIGLV
ncbi:MAG TPA: hypothetical protein PLG47_06100, partial [Candidatus Dojkabacteria bacterium]|nr:hypothetical protein [Candidatus Dojkabacteria bacterium]